MQIEWQMQLMDPARAPENQHQQPVSFSSSNAMQKIIHKCALRMQRPTVVRRGACTENARESLQYCKSYECKHTDVGSEVEAFGVAGGVGGAAGSLVAAALLVVEGTALLGASEACSSENCTSAILHMHQNADYTYFQSFQKVGKPVKLQSISPGPHPHSMHWALAFLPLPQPPSHPGTSP